MAENKTADEATEDTGDLEIGPDGSAVRSAQGGFTFHFTFDFPKLPKIDTLKGWSHQSLINGGLIAALALVLLYLAFDHFTGGSGTAATVQEAEVAVASPLGPNMVTEYNPNEDYPVADGAYVDPTARVIGAAHISEGAYVGRFVTVASDAGQPIHIGANSNIQDLAVIGAQPTFVFGKLDPAAFAPVPDGGEDFAVYVGTEVSIASQAQVYGPVAIGDASYIGMQALVADATIGAGVVIEPGAIVIGVTIADGRYVPAGEVVTSQHAADSLPTISSDYPFRRIGRDTVDLYLALAVSLGATPATIEAHAADSTTDSHAADSAHPAADDTAGASAEDGHSSPAEDTHAAPAGDDN